jgi:uncharacterized membrane protein
MNKNREEVKITIIDGTPGAEFHSKSKLAKAVKEAGLRLKIQRYKIEAPKDIDINKVVDALRIYEGR